jgi:hypothetical protein
MSPATFLPGYFDALDDGEDVLPMLAHDFSFSLLWSTPERANSRAGSTSGAATWSSGSRRAAASISHSLREGDTEVATGWTTRHGDPLGTFTFTVELDGDGRARRLFAARTEAFGGVPF